MLLLLVIYIAYIGLGIPDSLFGPAWPTMHEDFGWGYERLSRLAEKWGETYDRYFPALQSTDESDVWQERLDRATLAFLGDHTFYPFPKRYPEIKRLGYEPKRRSHA